MIDNTLPRATAIGLTWLLVYSLSDFMINDGAYSVINVTVGSDRVVGASEAIRQQEIDRLAAPFRRSQTHNHLP